MKQWLNSEQTVRLAEVVNEGVKLYSQEGLARRLGCSTGILSGIRTHYTKGVSEYFALYICRGLGVNPYYVTHGFAPKYRKWETAFFADKLLEDGHSSR